MCNKDENAFIANAKTLREKIAMKGGTMRFDGKKRGIRK